MNYLEFIDSTKNTISTKFIEEKIDISGIHYIEFIITGEFIDKIGSCQM